MSWSRAAPLAAAAVALAACAAAQPGPDGWATADPAALGLDTDALALHQEACRRSGADACLVAYRGQIVQEWTGPGYVDPMPTRSSVKSWTGLVTGALVGDGTLALDDPVARWLPEWTAGAEAGVTVRHLLTMTSGLDRRRDRGRAVGFEADQNAFVLGLPLDRPPGEAWAYSNEGVQLLGVVLERASGRPLAELFQTRLFGPAGMVSTRLTTDARGHALAYADAATTVRDFARVAQLMLQAGAWDGRQVVPADWVAASTEPVPQNGGYGFLWWLSASGGRVVSYGTRGARDTDCWVFPEAGLVVARMQAQDRVGMNYYDLARGPVLALVESATLAASGGPGAPD